MDHCFSNNSFTYFYKILGELYRVSKVNGLEESYSLLVINSLLVRSHMAFSHGCSGLEYQYHWVWLVLDFFTSVKF